MPVPSKAEGEGARAVTTHWLQRRDLVKLYSHGTSVKAESWSNFTDGKTDHCAWGHGQDSVLGRWRHYLPVPSGCFPTSNRFPAGVTDLTSVIRKLNGGEDSQPRNTKQKMQLTHCKNKRGWDYSYSAWVKIWSLLAFFSPEPYLVFVQGVSCPAEVGGMYPQHPKTREASYRLNKQTYSLKPISPAPHLGICPYLRGVFSLGSRFPWAGCSARSVLADTACFYLPMHTVVSKLWV